MYTRQYYVYLMSNPGDTALYVGVTNNLPRRVYEHQHKLVPGFTARYNIVKLVYYEAAPDVYAAIGREKQLKAGSRKKKIDLVNSANPGWKDLSGELS